MAISAEWILNAARQKIYAISHAKAVIRGNSTVDADLTALEDNLTQFESDLDALEQEVDGLDLSNVSTHISQKINSSTGVHGFRYYNDELQYSADGGTTWITIETGAGGVPPADMKSVSVGLGSDETKLVIKCTDPDDSVDSNGTTIAKWAGTKIVRKVGSYPTKVSDGTLVVNYQTRNQYASHGFVDTGLVGGETYYYRFFPYSDQGAVNLSTDTSVNRARKKTPQNCGVVGVTADWANNTYTRTDMAVGQSAGTFFDDFQMFGGRKRCIVADNRLVLAYYGDAAYTETGKLTQAVTKNRTTYEVGTSVQVMVIQPKFYYKVTPITSVANPNGTGYMIKKATYQVAEVQYDGFKVHPNFVRNGVEIPYMLQSAFEACTQDHSNTYITNNASLGNRLASIAGAKPATGSDGSHNHSFTRAVARRLAATRGSIGWQIGDMLTAACTQLLFMIEYCGMNSQSLLGKGNVSNTSSYDGVLATGGTSSLGNASGNGGNNDGKHSVTYRGEENMWGNVWTWQDGGNGYNSKQGILYWADHGFADDTSSSPYKSSGFNFARSNNYISAFGYSESCDFMFIPAEVLGDSAHPVGDYFYQNYSSNSMTVAQLGGSCVDGSRVGLFNWSVASASSDSRWSVGSRLACVPSASSTELEDAA